MRLFFIISTLVGTGEAKEKTLHHLREQQVCFIKVCFIRFSFIKVCFIYLVVNSLISSCEAF